MEITSSLFNDIFGILENMPNCSEAYLIKLYENPQAANETMLNELEQLLSKEDLKGIDGSLAVDVLKKLANSGDYDSLKSKAKELLHNVRAVDVELIIKLLKQTTHASADIINQNIILLMGNTGAGKSTAVHFLAGSEMVEIEEDDMRHIRPKNLIHKELNEFTTSNQQKSTTKTMNTFKMPLDDNCDGSVIFCDTPGFNDTDGVEVDIVNGIGMINAVKQCRSVLPVILISRGSIGDRADGILDLSNTILNIFGTQWFSKIQYVFTKYYEDKRSLKEINKIIKNKLSNLNSVDKQNLALVALFNDMIEKTKTDPLSINPLADNPKILLNYLCGPSRAAIENPNEAFNYFVTTDSISKLKLQLNQHSSCVMMALKHFDVDLYAYKLAQLFYLNVHLNTNETIQAYNDCVSKISVFLQNEFNEISSCLDDMMIYPIVQIKINCFDRIRNVVKIGKMQKLLFSSCSFDIESGLAIKFKTILSNLYEYVKSKCSGLSNDHYDQILFYLKNMSAILKLSTEINVNNMNNENEQFKNACEQVLASFKRKTSGLLDLVHVNDEHVKVVNCLNGFNWNFKGLFCENGFENLFKIEVDSFTDGLKNKLNSMVISFEHLAINIRWLNFMSYLKSYEILSHLKIKQKQLVDFCNTNIVRIKDELLQNFKLLFDSIQNVDQKKSRDINIDENILFGLLTALNGYKEISLGDEFTKVEFLEEIDINKINDTLTQQNGLFEKLIAEIIDKNKTYEAEKNLNAIHLYRSFAKRFEIFDKLLSTHVKFCNVVQIYAESIFRLNVTVFNQLYKNMNENKFKEMAIIIKSLDLKQNDIKNQNDDLQAELDKFLKSSILNLNELIDDGQFEANTKSIMANFGSICEANIHVCENNLANDIKNIQSKILRKIDQIADKYIDDEQFANVEEFFESFKSVELADGEINQKIQSKYQKIYVKLDAIILKYKKIDLTQMAQYSPVSLFEQLDFINRTYQHSNVISYKNAKTKLENCLNEQINGILQSIIELKNCEEDQRQLDRLKDYTRLFLPNSYINRYHVLFDECKQNIQKAIQTIERQLNVIVTIDSFRKLVEFMIELFQRGLFELARKAQLNIMEQLVKAYKHVRSFLNDNEQFSKIFANLPQVLDDHAFYVKQLNLINEQAATHGISFDCEIFQISINIILPEIHNYIKNILTSEIADFKLDDESSERFEKIVAYLKFHFDERVVGNWNLLKLAPFDLSNDIKLYFGKIKSYFDLNQYPNEFTHQSFELFAKVLQDSRKIQAFGEKIKTFSSTPLFQQAVMNVDMMVTFNDTFANILSHEQMVEKFKQQIDKWKKSCVSESFVGNTRTTTLNATDRDDFYLKINVSIKCLERADKYLNRHFGDLISRVLVECKVFIEGQVGDFDVHINQSLNKIHSGTMSVYSNFNILHDNLRSMAHCFEFCSSAGGKLTMIDMEFDCKLDELATKALNAARLEVFCNIIIQLKSMSLHVPTYTIKIDAKIDKLLKNLQQQENGTQKIGELGVVLNKMRCEKDGNLAQMLIVEHDTFRDYAIYLRNKTTLTFTVKNLISTVGQPNGLRCVDEDDDDDDENDDAPNRKKFKKTPVNTTANLEREFKLFDEEYWELVEQGLASKHDAEIIKSEIVDESQSIAASNDNNKLRRLMAHVFAYWTLSNLTFYFNQKNNKQSEETNTRNFLKQPHAAQIIAMFRLFNVDKNEIGLMEKAKSYFGLKHDLKLNNHLVQVLTGEGKSVVLAFTALILALLGYHVDCVCYSNYLSSRDYGLFEQIFEDFDVNEDIEYGTFDLICEEFINKDIDVRQAVETLITTGKNLNSTKETNSQQKVLLIDEVDVFFNKDFFGDAYGPRTSIKDPKITALINFTWESRRNLNIKNIKFSQQYLQCVNRFKEWEAIFEKSVKEMVSHLKNIKYHHYVLGDNEIGYKSQDEIAFGTTDGYYTLFAHFIEHNKGKITYGKLQEQMFWDVGCGRFSYAMIPASYDYIMGVTGTLDSLNAQQMDLLKTSYKISKFSYIPSVYGQNKLSFNGNSTQDFKISANKASFYTELTNEIKHRLKNGQRAVLVFLETSAHLQEFYDSDELADMRPRIRTMTEHTKEKNKENIVRQAITSGSVTLLTREFGRGTDFICYDDALIENGGVHVIQTFVSDEITEEIQIKGRTARQGNVGSFSFVINESELKRYKIDKKMIIEMTNKGNFYSAIDDKRREYFIKKYNQMVSGVEKIKQDHLKSIEFLGSLVNCDTDKIKSFLFEKYS